MKLQLAFYKGKGNIYDKLIRFWTDGPYSHVELVINDVCYSSSPRDGGVRKKQINLKSGNWDVFDLDSNQYQEAEIIRFVEGEIEKGAKYDWMGIFFGQFIRFLNLQDPNKWFCSEFCSWPLKVKEKPWKLHPWGLFKDIFVETEH